jgi:putative peptidoglycan lipid II flippase
MAAVLWIASGSAADWLVAPGAERVVNLALIITLGAAVYFAMLWLLGFRVREFMHRGAE